MNVTFRATTKGDIVALSALGVRHVPSSASGSRGTVVRINSHIVLAFDVHGEVLYQDGSGAIPDLIRAAKRVWGAMGTLTYDDLERIKRKGKPRPSIHDILRGATQ